MIDLDKIMSSSDESCANRKMLFTVALIAILSSTSRCELTNEQPKSREDPQCDDPVLCPATMQNSELGCDSKICRGEGFCKMLDDKPVCDCFLQYFTGPTCNKEVDNCRTPLGMPHCDPVGTERCISYFGGRFCSCRKNYRGTLCAEYFVVDKPTYFNTVTNPAVYFQHQMFEGEEYPLYVVFENISEYTTSLEVSIEKQDGLFHLYPKEFKKNNRLAYYMGLTNYPPKLSQKYYHELRHVFKKTGPFRIQLSVRSSYHSSEWTVRYYYVGAIMQKPMQFGTCPPIIYFTGGVCTNAGFKGIKGKVVQGVQYKISHHIAPCNFDDDIKNVSYYVSDLYDIHTVHQYITQVFSSPPVILNHTSSLVVKVDGLFGTTYIQCFVEYVPHYERKGPKIVGSAQLPMEDEDEDGPDDGGVDSEEHDEF